MSSSRPRFPRVAGALLITVLLALAGCGDDSAGSSSTTTDDAEEAATPEPSEEYAEYCREARRAQYATTSQQVEYAERLAELAPEEIAEAQAQLRDVIVFEARHPENLAGIAKRRAEATDAFATVATVVMEECGITVGLN